MSLNQAIKKWDRKSSDYISDVYANYCDSSSFSSELITLMEQERLQLGASWLLKKHVENGAILDSKESIKFYALLNKLEYWETKLHVLQCIHSTKIQGAQKNKVEEFLRKCLSDTNKFIRAWGYNGFYELSKQHKQYQKETKELFEMALRDEAASVKARVRKCVTKGF